MKRVILFVLILFSGFFVSNGVALAEGKTASDIMPHAGVEVTKENKKNNCSSIFGDPKNPSDTAYYMQQAFNIMKFLGIIFAVVMTIKDLITAVSEQKSDMYAKLPGKTVKRLIYAALIFMLPSIIELLFSAIGLYGATCNIS